MKVRVAYTMDLSPEQVKAALAYARAVGLDGENLSDRKILQRLLKDKGREGVYYAEERVGVDTDTE